MYPTPEERKKINEMIKDREFVYVPTALLDPRFSEFDSAHEAWENRIKEFEKRPIKSKLIKGVSPSSVDAIIICGRGK